MLEGLVGLYDVDGGGIYLADEDGLSLRRVAAAAAGHDAELAGAASRSATGRSAARRSSAGRSCFRAAAARGAGR